MNKLEKIFDDCLSQLMSGQGTLEECLAKYPEHADELSRLMLAATHLEQGREVRPSPLFRNRARAQLIAHMNVHPRHLRPTWWRSLSLLQLGFVFGRTANVAFGLAAIILLFLTTGTVLAQTALPGDTLYGWRLTSEQVLRKIYPDSLGVDLMIAHRRLNDLVRVGDDLQAETLALKGYEQSLVYLSTYSDPEAQVAISQALIEQKVSLDQAQITAPKLEELLAMFKGEVERLPADNIRQAALELDYKAVAVEAERIIYSLTITNHGPVSPIDATLIIILSPAEKLVSTDDKNNCNPADDGSLTCLITNLSTDSVHQLTLTTAVEPCYSGLITSKVMVRGADNITINSDSQLAAESRIDPSFLDPARVVYVQSDQQNHSLGLVTSVAEMMNDRFHLRAAAPAWSPDGSQLAFFGEQGISELGGIYTQGNGVWVVDVVGPLAQNPKQLLAQDHIKNIAWSPNGAMLAVEVGIPELPHEVVVIKARDGRQVSRFRGEQPAWSPDSRSLVIKGCSPGCGLWQVDIEGNLKKQMTFDGTDSYPAWSPDGRHLAFASQRRHGNWEIYLLRLADNRVLRLTHRFGTDTTPVFGPCGQEIYVRMDEYGSWWITAIALNSHDEYKIKEGVGPTEDWGLARPAVY